MADISKKFLSLKWKAGLLFGLLLLIFNATFPALVYWTLQKDFDFSRQQIQQHYTNELSGHIQSSRHEIQRLAEFVLPPDAINIDPQEQGLRIINALTQHQSELELNWNISQAQYLNSKGEFLGGWGPKAPDNITQNIPNVVTSELAFSKIDCSQRCKQYIVIPVLGNKKTSFVLLIAYEMTDILLAFHSETGADIGLLTPNGDGTDPYGYSIPEWDVILKALTSYTYMIDHIKTLVNSYAFNQINSESRLIGDKSQRIEAQFISIDQVDATFVILDDVTTQYQDIVKTTYQSIFIALLGVVILGVGLFYFISAPLSRLSSVSKALPLLAKKQYDTVRALVSPKECNHTLDELDILENTTQDVSFQLEQLEKIVKLNSNLINQRNIELQQERDFVKSLIDTAQLIIITLDKQCNISSFNDYAVTTTGYKEQDIIGTPMSQFIPKEQWPEILDTLSELKLSPDAVAQQESEFIHSDGSIHAVSWLHSSLGNTSGTATILSVGLDITEKKKSEEQITWMADHDELTNLYNRRRFNIEFEKLLATSKRFGHQGALLFLDLDQFKDINDSCGHHIGDQLLKQVAQTLVDLTRSTDIVARLGGDEFAILLPESTDIGAEKLADKICQALTLITMRVKDINYKISASIGLIIFPQADFTIDELVSNADIAMYQAKAKGKNTWHQYSLDDQAREQLESRLFWKQKIETALEKKYFIFYYQPIMEIRTRTVSHYEVLIRMKNEDGSISFPGSFIEVAEQTGLIHAIDHYVLKQGIEKQAELDKSGTNISLALNLSGHAVDDPILLPLVKRFLDESKAEPSHLIFELTETAAVADVVQAREFMTQLMQIGCRFSIDDFGTGFSSFRYMRELPVDIVKIDGSFITNLANNPDDQLFVKALIDVAKGMGKKTVAEFVENAETLALLHAFGVDYAQGYYIGKPSPDFLNGPPVLK